MSNEKGFTLIEVIVSLAIIGLLALVFLPILVNHYKWIIDTNANITETAFDAQEVMEDNVNRIKTFISETSFTGEIESTDFNSMGITKKISSVQLFNTKYPIASYSNRQFPNAYQTEEIIYGNRVFKTWVGDKRIPELAVPEIKGVSLLLTHDGVDSGNNFEYYNYPNLSLKANSNMIKNPQNSFNRYRNDWFVSKPGFMIPVQKIGYIDEDVDFGRIYPEFPEDYMSAPFLSNLGVNYSYVSMNERNISVVLANSYVSQYPGRHIIYTITPFAKSLKKGNVSELLPVYIYGPLYTDSLAVHLDASTVDLSDVSINPSTISTESIYDSPIDDLYRFKRWKNNRPSLKASSRINDAKQADENKMPVLKETNIVGTMYPEIPFQNIDGIDKVWGRVLGNKDSLISTMKISNLNIEEDMSVFMIFRMVDFPLAPQEGAILSGNGDDPWNIGWKNDNGILKLGFTNLDNTLFSNIGTSVNQGQWYLIRATVKDNLREINLINLTHSENPIDPVKLEYSGIDEIDIDSIDINFNGVEISEILVYDSDISSELKNVEDYLSLKYNP